MDSITPTNQMVHRDEIRWTLEPRLRLEDTTAEAFLALDPVELLTYAADSREDLRAVREMLHQALEMIARLQDQLARAGRVVEYQRQQLRTLHERQAA